MRKINYFYNLFTFTISLFLIRLLIRFTSTKKTGSNAGVVFLESFPIENAGYQYRAKLWSDIISQNERSEVFTTIEDRNTWNDIFQNSLHAYLRKSMWIRYRQIKRTRQFRRVIVRRELLQFNDYGNLFMEKFLLKIHPDAILDFDDNLAASKQEPRTIESTYGRFVSEHGSKFTESLHLYQHFITGSDFLKVFLQSKRPDLSSDHVICIPTCVDYTPQSPIKKYNDFEGPVRIGWIGNDGNQYLLNSIIEDLNRLHEKHPVKLVVISKTPYKHAESQFPIENISWSMETQIQSMLSLDIGVMPVDNTAAGRGKAGFKLIQYMGLGIVSIASNVTVNGEIVRDNHNGFLVPPGESWLPVFLNILEQKDRFDEIGKFARNYILDNYSFIANSEKYKNFIT